MKCAGEEHLCRAIEMGQLVLNGSETLSTHGVVQAAKWGQTNSLLQQGAASLQVECLYVCVCVCVGVHTTQNASMDMQMNQQWIIVLQQTQ